MDPGTPDTLAAEPQTEPLRCIFASGQWLNIASVVSETGMRTIRIEVNTEDHGYVQLFASPADSDVWDTLGHFIATGEIR